MLHGSSREMYSTSRNRQKGPLHEGVRSTSCTPRNYRQPLQDRHLDDSRSADLFVRIYQCENSAQTLSSSRSTRRRWSCRRTILLVCRPVRRLLRRCRLGTTSGALIDWWTTRRIVHWWRRCHGGLHVVVLRLHSWAV